MTMVQMVLLSIFNVYLISWKVRNMFSSRAKKLDIVTKTKDHHDELQACQYSFCLLTRLICQ